MPSYRGAQMEVRVLPDKESLGRTAAEHAASSLRTVLHDQEWARIVVATGASQFEFLDALTAAPGIDWGRVEMFHLDEYIGLPLSHPASFRKYLLERLIHKTAISEYHLLETEGDIQEMVRHVGEKLNSRSIDLAFVALEKMPILLSMTLRRILGLKILTLLSISMKPAVASRWLRVGSPIFRRCPFRLFPCPFVRS